MSNALKRQRGFSLPETVLAMALMVLTVTALGGYQRGMAQGVSDRPDPVNCGATRGAIASSPRRRRRHAGR